MKIMGSLDNISLEQFLKKSRAVRFPRYAQRTRQFSHVMQIGCDYYVYVCKETLEVINPFTKKHEGRDYKSFFSSISADNAKEQAYNYIKNFLK